MGLLALWLGIALAGDPGSYRFGLVGGAGAGVGTPSPVVEGGFSGVGYVTGRLLIQGSRAAAEFGAREGWAGSDSRSLGNLFFGARIPLGDTLYLRAGFAHHHEVPEALVLAEPLQSVLGSATGIRHRSGAELGLGGMVPIEERQLGDRLGVCADLGLVAFPDEHGPRAYAFADVSVIIGAGARRASPED